MKWPVAFGVFIKYYGLDPLDMSYSRFLSLYNSISAVMYELTPKTEFQQALENAEAEKEQQAIEDAIEAGLDPTNPLYDKSELKANNE
jgi:hypothetical protein